DVVGRPDASRLDRGARAERLPEAELDVLAVGISHAAVVADRVRLVAGRPHESSILAGALGHGVDGLATLERETEVTVVVGGLRPRLGSREQHQDELTLAAGLRHPRHVAALALVHDPHA